MFVVRTEIRSEIQGDVEHVMDTPNILDCNELRSFWISWNSGFVQVGQGMVVGRGVLLGWQDEEDIPRPINWISVSTGFGSTGEWELFTVKRECKLAVIIPYVHILDKDI